ncbi:MAG: T9SS type A sorting domain-containing protein [candidate division WOR-3 bacterium]
MSILLSVLFSMGIVNSKGNLDFPKIKGSVGGPDQYGYIWIDNDTTGIPGIPEYNWIDITPYGTEVQGLGDDNVVGPFPIGFQFPYYWYKVDRFWVCSNGLISFSSNQMWSPHQGGSQIPSPTLPNDLLVVLGGDLNFNLGRGKVYYWSNGQDTLIVSFIDVPEWHFGTDTLGSHTFQLILDRNDSTITFQYGPQRGKFNYGHPAAPPAFGIGIENITGQIGLQYLKDDTLSPNMFHEGLAIRFYPPETTTYQVTDLTMYEISPNNQGFFLIQNEGYIPYAIIKNSGNLPVSAYQAFCRIRRLPQGTIVYNDTVQMGSINPGEFDTVYFDGWTPSIAGKYEIIEWVKTAGDQVPINDTLHADVPVVQRSNYVILDFINDTTQANFTHWMGSGGGWGMRFVPPDTCEVIEVRVMLAAMSQAGMAYIYLYDDDGPGGLPGTILYQTSYYVSSSTPMWYTLNTQNYLYKEGALWVGYIQGGVEGPDFAVDVAAPYSRNTYEYTGAWAPYRDPFTDGCIRMVVNLMISAEEKAHEKNMDKPRIYNNMDGKIVLYLPKAKSKKIKIFDATGRVEVPEKIKWEGEKAILNLDKSKKGIYFIKTESGKFKIVYVK